MLLIPKLTKKQSDEIAEVRGMPGWMHIIEPMRVSIGLAEEELTNWVWDRDDNGDVTRKCFIEYEKIQYELHALRSLVAFFENNDIIEEDDDREVFENTSK